MIREVPPKDTLAPNTPLNTRRNGHNDDQTDCTDKDDVVQDLVQVILSRLTGTDTRDESTLLLHIVRYLNRIEGNGCIEVSKEDIQYNIQHQTNSVYRLTRD